MFEGVRTIWRSYHRALHTTSFSSSQNPPSETLKRKIAELEKIRKTGKKRNPRKDDFVVHVPESTSFLDTATMPMVLTAVAVALLAKLLMMYDESNAQERIERKIQKAPAEQGTVRMLSREEWEEIQEVRPRTPFESKLARPNARVRSGEPLSMGLKLRLCPEEMVYLKQAVECCLEIAEMPFHLELNGESPSNQLKKMGSELNATKAELRTIVILASGRSMRTKLSSVIYS